MNKDDIITLPNIHLRERSKKVGLVDEKIKKIIQDMQAATLDWEASRDHEVGVALAAIQVDIHLRIVVVRNNFDNKDDKSFTVLINPEITKYEGKVEHDYEGCLSIKDVYGRVPRHSKVRVKAQDQNGRFFRITAEGFLARVMQHEIDHTNGIVFIDRIKNDKTAFYKLLDDGKLESIDYEKHIKDNSILW
ncbi:MAG TPA: peptide deformylase [Candidatus Saccharimonadales bacterium]